MRINMSTKQATFTPGPWEAAGLHTYAGNVKIAAPLDEDSTELYGEFLASPKWEYPDCATAKCNARLISAAPDLLAALAALVKYGEAINHAFYGVGSAKAMKAAMEGQRELLEAARAAIAKAVQL